MTHLAASSPNAVSLAERVSTMLLGVMAAVRMRMRPLSGLWRGIVIPDVVAAMVCDWLERRRKRIADLIRRIEDGRLKPPRSRGPKATTPQTDAATRNRAAPPSAAVRMPRLLGWGLLLGQEMAAPRAGLTELMDEPALRRMAVAHPPLARLLRPLLTMLGSAPDWLPKPPPRSRNARRILKREEGEAGADPPALSLPDRLARLIAQGLARNQDEQRYAIRTRRPGDREPAHPPIHFPAQRPRRGWFSLKLPPMVPILPAPPSPRPTDWEPQGWERLYADYGRRRRMRP